MLGQGSDRRVVLVEHDATSPSTEREVESDDASGAVETNVCMCARSLDLLATKLESCLVPKPTHVLLGFVPTPCCFVVDGHARHRDLGPR